MHCKYCYYLEKGKFSTHLKQTRMSFTLLERLIRQTIEGNPGPVVSFTWHGGEPTIAGLDFYKKVIEFEKKYLPRGWQAWNNLQTNGLLINDSWAKFLKENSFDVGISIDGDELVHNSNRLDISGHVTYGAVRTSVYKLKKVGIQPDLLCTVNSVTVRHSLDVYKSLRELDTGWIQFVPIVIRLPDGSYAPETVMPGDYGNFLCAVFDEWIKSDLGKLDVQLFAETSRILAGGKPSVCWMNKTCGRVLVVEEDGSIYSCDHFVDDEHRLGNLASSRLSTLASNQIQAIFGNSKKALLIQECKSCPYLNLCGGGCLKDRFNEESGQYFLCSGMKKFFSHAVPVLNEAIKLSIDGMNAEEIKSRLSRNL